MLVSADHEVSEAGVTQPYTSINSFKFNKIEKHPE